MTSIKWEAGSDSTVMTTELNSLADDGLAVSPEIDNSSALYLFDDVELVVNSFSSAPSLGALVELHLIRKRLSNSGYEDGESVAPSPTTLVGAFEVRNSSGTQIHVLRQIPIPPSAFKYVLRNKTGRTFASSSNQLRRKPYRYQTV